MSDLAAFLRARLKEDEAAAQSQADWLREREKRPGDWTRFMFDPVIGPFGGQSPLRSIDRGLYVGRMADPDRVLREVAAKRAILVEHPIRSVRNATCQVCTDVEGTSYLSYLGDEHTKAPPPCPTLRALAAVYSDHPDYQKEWNEKLR